MFALAARSLRHRKGGFAATFLALFFGVTLVMACGGLLETGIRNNAPPERLARADVLVTGDRSYELPGRSADDAESAVLAERVPLDGEALDTVRGVDGVGTAVAERTFDAALLAAGGGGRTEVHGHGWESAALTPYELGGDGGAGAAPVRADEVVLDARTARDAHAEVGDRVRLAAHGGSATYTVTGIAEPRGGREVAQRTVFFSDRRADALAGGEAADIAVTAAAGQHVGALKSRIAEALDGTPVKVVTGDDRGAVEYPKVEEGREALIPLAAVFGGLAALVAVFVVAGTIALSVQQRQREFALMRAIGGTPRQLRRMLLGETLLVALLAAALGWFAGPLVGRWLFDRLVNAGLIAEVVEHSAGWIPAAAAGGALLLTALLGGWAGARRGVRARPTEALAEAALQERWLHPVRLILALVFLGGATALAIVTLTVFDGPIAASTAGPTVMAAAIGLALLGPGLTKLMMVLLSGPVRWFTGVGGELAVLNSRARAVRLAAVVTPIMLATGMATGQLYLQTTQIAASEKAFQENLRADAVVTSAAGGVDPALLGEVRRTEGVAAASAYVTSTGFLEGEHGSSDEDGLPLQGVSAEGVTKTTSVRATSGSLADLRGRTIALPASEARRYGAGVGDTLKLRLGDRARVDVRVVALFEGRDGYETGLTPATLLAPHTTEGLPQQILVRAEGGSEGGAEGGAEDGSEGGADLAGPTGPLGELVAKHPGLAVGDRDALLDANAEEVQTQAWINYLMVGLIVAYTAIAVVNSLVMSTRSRRREFGLQRLSGATSGQVLRMVTIEALLATAMGVVLGTLAASTSLIPFSVAAADSYWPSGPLWIYGAIVGTAGALALAATLLPTVAALRSRPALAALAAE